MDNVKEGTRKIEERTNNLFSRDSPIFNEVCSTLQKSCSLKPWPVFATRTNSNNTSFGRARVEEEVAMHQNAV